MRNRWTVRLAAVVACSVTAIAGAVPAAQASYPGADGRIAFGMADATGAHIYSVRPDGRSLHQLTSGPYTDLCAAYAAGGDRIAFCSNRSGRFEIWTMTADGHDLRRVTDLAFAAFPDFSPSGQQIAFDGQTAADPSDEIFVINTDGSHLRKLTHAAGNNDYPSLVTGRPHPCVHQRPQRNEQVFTMRSDGTHLTQLTSQPVAHDQLPDWNPNGRAIAYTQGDVGTNEKIWVMSADGSHQRQVSHGSDDDFGAAWSPDGRSIAFVRAYP